MMCRKSSSLVDKGTVPVYLNVYDLTPINGYAYWLGLGVYHSGVEVHGIEYAFGAHEYPTTGIFEGEPKQCEGFTFRKSILIGKTDMEQREVRAVMEDLADSYKGNSYNLITKNCNHFCDEACIKLTGNPIPSWVNRLARIGFMCNCVLPATINTTKIGNNRINQQDKLSEAEIEKKKLTSVCNGETSTSTVNSFSPSSSSPMVQVRGRSRKRRPRSLQPSSSPLILGGSSSV
ncbi:PREDICTED: deSI-like protein At4g17486 isoform X2 [Tarenaya hassleriana]|uniref:deSI-like protein At4g17486 isoform X2 n=1 Tax=Tarenaya hassleriana TaxID=28532 RepID=UPI00053C0BE2|nr:PREDICTED: deSI-like protein At4g17486 isoform X2 [Tarenaya hassleriana]